MMILLTIVHVIVCVFLVIVVLLQSGKAADLAGAFGGMGSQTAFGPRGAATLLSKATTIAAGLFMVTSLTLSIGATKGAGSGGSSVLERQKKPATSQQKSATPAVPVTPAPTTVTPGNPAPIQPGGTVAPGQPAVELDYGNGVKKTVPIDINKLPKVDPKAAPATPAPAAPKK